MKPLSLFISSTCYDLVDLRFELKAFLEDHRFDVHLSEDPTSAFFVDPTGDSIESCLRNVEQSDAVILILDRAYGPVLSERYDKVSATHAELKHARKHDRALFCFIRNVAYAEYSQLRDNPKFKTKWIEKNSPKRRSQWKAFVDDVFEPYAGEKRRIWIDQFHSVVDLKSTILSRISAHFQVRSVEYALTPERLVRIAFIPDGNARFGASVGGKLMNCTANTAFSVRHGVSIDGAETWMDTNRGALPFKSSLTPDNESVSYDLGDPRPAVERFIVCEYANAFGDRYRVEVPFRREVDHNAVHHLSTSTVAREPVDVLVIDQERFFVGMPSNNGIDWISASHD